MIPQGTRVAVWPAAVRLGHWTLATGVLGCLILYQGGPWHERLGYAVLAVAVWRALLGFATRAPHLRFAGFVQGPRLTLGYLQVLIQGREPRHLGHNPLGGWMIVALLACAAVAATSGALYTTDRYWGDDLVYGVHQVSGWGLAVLIPLHVLGAMVTSLRHRENLVSAMITGWKRPPAPGDVGLSPMREP